MKTKEKQFFDKNGSNVIAYGEMIFDSATSGDGMIEFTINLNYTRTDVKPSSHPVHGISLYWRRLTL